MTVFGLLLVGLLLASFAPAYAQTDAKAEIRQLIEQRDRQIKEVLGQQGSSLTDAQRTQLKDLINGMIDFQTMSRLTLGSFWEDLSADERAAFVEVFSTIVRAHSLSDLAPYRAEMTIGEITVDGDAAHVVTRTVYEGEPIQVEYDLILTGEGWRATDVIIDGVSTVEGYQRSFQTVIRKKGFDALMQSLREREQEITS